VVATAHPAKFEQVVEPLIGHRIEVPAALATLLRRPATDTPLAADDEALRQWLRQHASGRAANRSDGGTCADADPR
jgi:threonine synthase